MRISAILAEGEQDGWFPLVMTMPKNNKEALHQEIGRTIADERSGCFRGLSGPGAVELGRAIYALLPAAGKVTQGA